MEKVLNRIQKYPVLVLIIILGITVIFFFAMKDNTRMETDLDKYMPETHPAFVYSNQAEEWFNIKDGIIIAIENNNGIYNTETLNKIKSLTKDLQSMEEVGKSDVTSLYTADNITGSDWGLEVEPFFTKVPTTDSKLEAIRLAVRENDMVYRRLISEDDNVALIIANIEDDVFSEEFYQKILDLAAEYEGDEKLYVAGRPIVEGTLASLGPADMAKMVPIVIVVIILVLFLLLNSIKATVMTLAVVLFSVLWTFGLMAVTGIPIYAVSTMIPVMLIAIGVADGIHLINHLRNYMNNNPDSDKNSAISDMITHMWKPVVMTSITTAIGFISLLTSEVYPIKYFGIFTAFGVMMAMSFSLILLPAGLKVMGLPKWTRDKKKTKNNSGFATKYTNFILKYKLTALLLTVGIVVLSLWGMTRVWIDTSFLSQFDKDTGIVQADMFINNNFGGTSSLNVILDADEPGAFKDPEVLKAIEAMQNDIEDSLDKVGNSFSLTDYLNRMNMVMHADDPEYDKTPETQEMVAQYLLLYEMSGDPDNLWEVVDYNYQKANMTFQLKDDSSQTISSAINQIEAHLSGLETLGIHVNYAGSGYKGLVFSQLILEGQILSIIVSLFIVIILLGFMFKNLLLGFIGAVPIVITAFISFGIMGILNIPLSTTTALLSSIAIGIGIDYAVHFIEMYRNNSINEGSKLLTLERTMQHSGKAILYNAIVVIAGFMVLIFSLFPLNRALGALVSLNMFTSFIGTISIMAVILFKSNIFFKNK